MEEVCTLTPFTQIPQWIAEGNTLWSLSDNSETLFDGMIHALSIMLDTIVYCPCQFAF